MRAGSISGTYWQALVNFYDPQMIVIGGGVSNLGNLLLSSIRQAVLQRSTPLATRDLQIVFSEIGADAGVLGAVSLATEYMFSLSPAGSSSKSMNEAAMKFGVNTFVWVSPCTTQAIRDLAPIVRSMGFDILEISVENPSSDRCELP